MTTSSFDWNELSKYAASKKLDYLVDDDDMFEVTQVVGYDGLTPDEVLEMTKEETMWMTLCLLYKASQKYGIKTFKLTAIEQEEIDEIPYCIAEMPNGDRYLTFN